MARQRRGGFRPPELRGTLGTLLRTTLAQAGTIRDVLERGAREGRSRIDDALATRRRTDTLSELGEIVLDLIRRGEIDLHELPEVRELVAHLDELDAGASHDEPPLPPTRKRFDSRRTARDDDDDGTVSAAPRRPAPAANKPPAARVWRPPADDRAAQEVTARERPVPRDLAGRKGGISFDDDDLADYMHPDDVPPKGSDGDP